MLPSAGTGAPTRMRLEISTCILLTILSAVSENWPALLLYSLVPWASFAEF